MALCGQKKWPIPRQRDRPCVIVPDQRQTMLTQYDSAADLIFPTLESSDSGLDSSSAQKNVPFKDIHKIRDINNRLLTKSEPLDPSFRWSNPTPYRAWKTSILCNGQSAKDRCWRRSVLSHYYMAEKVARCVGLRLKSLPLDCQIARGAIINPWKSPSEWKLFKRRLSDCLKKHNTRNPSDQISIFCKQHITKVRTRTVAAQFSPDDMHFDFIAIFSGDYKSTKEKFLGWIASAGGNRSRSCFKLLENRSKSNMEQIANYTCKYPHDLEAKEAFFNRALIPATSFHVTWCIGDFWGRKPEVRSYEILFNGEEKTITKKLSAMDCWWRDYIESFSTQPPRIETTDYQVEKIINAVLDCDFESTNILDVVNVDCPIDFPEWVDTAKSYRKLSPLEE